MEYKAIIHSDTGGMTSDYDIIVTGKRKTLHGEEIEKVFSGFALTPVSLLKDEFKIQYGKGKKSNIIYLVVPTGGKHKIGTTSKVRCVSYKIS